MDGQIPLAVRTLGNDDLKTLTLRWKYATAIQLSKDASQDDHNYSVTILEDVERRARRVLGEHHPTTIDIRHTLSQGRQLAAALSFLS